MKNLEMASIFYAMADILEMQKVEWKPRAYRKAAKAIETLSEDIEEIYNKKGLKALMEIPGVGEKLALKIEEFVKTDRVQSYEKLKKSLPTGMEQLIEIPGVGPKKIYFLYQELDIKNLEDLEKAAKSHKIAKLKGFGSKSEENILRGIEIFRKGKERMLLGNALPIAQMIVDHLGKVSGVEHIEAAGSLRRRAETIGDIDILVSAENAAPVMDAFTTMPEVQEIFAKGPTKSMVILKTGIQADVRVVKDKSFGSALQYFTGNKDHNIELRKIAIKKGYKLSEYGIFKGEKQIAGENEEEVYKKLGLEWMPPEMRENTGEIEAAQKGKLPNLIERSDIKGDFHIHTRYSDGTDTVEEIARAAQQLGHEYICIADHSKSEHIAHGIEEERLLKQINEIKELNKKLKGFRILAGCEVDIKSDGSLDYSDDILKQLDVVSVSVHSGFKTPKEKMTERIISALENKYVKILNHPTGRIINARPPYEVDLEKIFETAAQNKIAMELNSFPARLDLNGQNVKRAIEMGVKIAIGTDSHRKDLLHYIDLGVSTARRGWAEKKDVLNTLSSDDLLRYWRIRSD